jgi:hypothetical protein
VFALLTRKATELIFGNYLRHQGIIRGRPIAQDVTDTQRRVTENSKFVSQCERKSNMLLNELYRFLYLADTKYDTTSCATLGIPKNVYLVFEGFSTRTTFR